jgi:hypothetical protein
MRFLVDANLSPRVATTLSSVGFKSIHVGDVGLLAAADQAILATAKIHLASAPAGPGRACYHAARPTTDEPERCAVT